MKKVLLVAVLAIVVVLVGYNLMSDHSSFQEKAGNSKREKALAVMKDNDCMSCHSFATDEPVYASIPIVGGLIEKDMKLGVANFDLSNVFINLEKNKAISESDLAKIEFAINNNSMPLAQYKIVHWGSAISDNEKETLLSWITEERANSYGVNASATKFANEPIRPIAKNFIVDSAKVALGFDLFHDTRLSADNTVSCANCHDLKRGGTDNLPVAIGIKGQRGPINSPTVYNSGYNIAQFWDGRAKTLQDQAAGPPLASNEMGNISFDDIVANLDVDKDLEKRFLTMYDEGITKNSITHAIAEYEKTLVTPNSPFDKYLKGDENAITKNQKEGYEAFKRVGCATCHAGEAMGGLSFEKVGIFGDYYADRGTGISVVDKGRANFTDNENDMFYLKVPLLRNIALTFPYFHDASAPTLKDAVVMMNKYQVKEKLNDKEINQVVDFLNALTGEYNGESL